MGNQGHSYNGHRRAVEILQTQSLGPVREAHVWTDRPIWPQGIVRPAETPPVPETLRWDLWLGPAPQRPYHPCYLPFNWRGWYDFGTGALGDMGCHNMDVVFWGLKLGAPTAVEALTSGWHRETYPKASVVRWEFPARGEMPPVTLTWYDGGNKPPQDLAPGVELPTNGALVVGENGTLFARDWHADGFKLLPEKEFEGFEGPDEFIPRSEGHYAEWIDACKGAPPALSNFGYSGPMTESVLLGNLAIRLRRRIDWDAERMRVPGCPEADPLIRPEIDW
jgi:predicted dehydrogenase